LRNVVEEHTSPGATGAIRVLIATPHRLEAERLTTILSGPGGFDILDSVCDGAAAVRAAEALRPDLIVLDTDLPLLNAVEATPVLRRKVPDATLVVLTPTDSGAGAAWPCAWARMATSHGAPERACSSAWCGPPSPSRSAADRRGWAAC
jgi:chemotaxis response regulator CheB